MTKTVLKKLLNIYFKASFSGRIQLMVQRHLNNKNMIAKDIAICIIELISVSKHFWPNQLSDNLKIKIPKKNSLENNLPSLLLTQNLLIQYLNNANFCLFMT